MDLTAVVAGGRRRRAWTPFLAAEPAVGSRAAAQRLIDAGLGDRGRQPRGRRATGWPGRARGGSIAAAAAPDDARAGAGSVRFEVVFEDEHLLVVDKPAGLVTHPAPRATTGTTLAEALAGARRAATDPERRRDRPPPRPRHLRAAAWWRSRRPRTPSSSGADPPRARSSASYLALVAGQPGRRQRHDRRRRSAATAASAERESRPAPTRGREAVTHFARRGGAPAHHAARRAARDRAHPPDPRAPRGDRPSGLRGPPLRGRRMRLDDLGSRASFCMLRALMFSHPITRGNTAVRVQTTRRAASTHRRGPAGASLRRARRELKDGTAGRLRGRPAPFLGLLHRRRGYPLRPQSRPTTPPGRRSRPCPGS